LAGAGLTGFEWAVGVPGSIGGAVRMNAGGHGSDMSASLVEITAFDFESGRLTIRPADELGLRFRGSSIGSTTAVLSATLQLAPGDPETSQQELSEIVTWRRTNQPGGQNAGSVFVNPVPGEVSAGELIDGLGLRGVRLGSATVSEKHANFIQADDGGTAADVHALMELVRARVHDATGYALRSEIRLIGFDEVETSS
jgi:UDP-N-acetylmuramate dehydrogenase